MSRGTPSGDQARAIRALGELSSDAALGSTIRLLILVSLAINGRLSFVDLMRLTGVGKGSLSNHLDRLREGGYVTTKRTLVWGGHRVVAELTEKGLATYGDYVSAIKELNPAANPAPAESGRTYLSR